MRRVEVVVLNWNGLEDTARCLDSLARLEPPPDGEVHVWVVDNGSTDGSPERLPERYPWARYLTLAENRRYGGGNNAGVRAALETGAEFVAVLNNDTVADPGLVRELVAAADAAGEAGILGPRIEDEHGRVWFAGGSLVRGLGWAWHRREGEAGPVDWITGCCLFARREVWEETGGYDEGYYLYAEDVDLCLRARARGWRCRYVPSARLVHYVSSSSGGAANPFKAYHRTRANLRLFGRHARGWRRLTWPLGFLALLYAHNLAWLLRGSPGAVAAAWRALWDAVRGRDAGRAFPAPARPTRESV